MQTVETTPDWIFGRSMTPTSYIPPEYHSSELASTPRQSTAPGAFGTATGGVNTDHQYESSAEASYASLQRAITAAEAAQGTFRGGFQESKTGLVTHDPNGFSTYATSASTDTAGPLLASALSDWSSRTSSGVWAPASQVPLEDPFEFYNGTLHQHHPLQQQQSSISSDECVYRNPIETYGLQHQPHLTSYPSQLVRQGPETQQQLCLPEPSRHPPALPEEAFTRRSSVSSELANTLGTIDIHSQQPPSQQQGVVFKQPDIPPLDIAARRNRRRPAALGATALRSRSCAGPLSMSPTAVGSFLGPSTPVRRIKSTSSNLNVAHGRIQKPTPGSAQRSPLQFQSFAEIDASNGANVMSRETNLSSQTMPSSASLASPTPLSPPDIETPQLPYLSDRHGLPFVYNTDYSAYFGPNTSGLDSNLASPPATPLNAEMLARLQQHVLQQQHLPQPPQSAPAFHTSFLQYSPPSSTGPPTCGMWSDAPTASPKVYSFPPTIHMPQPLYVSPIGYEDCGAASHFPNPFPHPLPLPLQNEYSRVGGSHHEFQINSDPKVPEFFFHEFPEQKQAHQESSKHLEPHKPKNYIFANATPDDF